MVIQFRRYWNLLVTYLKPQWTRVTLLTVLLFGSIGLQLGNPQIIRYFIDTTQAGGSTRHTLLFHIGALLCAVPTTLSCSRRVRSRQRGH